jgi:hypothetical protein
MNIGLGRRRSSGGVPNQPPQAAELIAERERLTERFALMQAELGGLFYEMAVRDHLRLDILTEKAAALQRVDGELAQVERLLESGQVAVGGRCSVCGALHARGAAYCAQCAHPLQAVSRGGDSSEQDA